MVSFTFTVPNPKLTEFKACVLAAKPNPPDSGLTDNQWLKQILLDHAKALYRRGKDIRHTPPVYDDNIIS